MTDPVENSAAFNASGRVPWRLSRTPPGDLAEGLREIAAHFPGRFTKSETGTALSFKHSESLAGRSWAAIDDAAGITVVYSRPGDAFRALGVLTGQMLRPGAASPRGERNAFEQIGMMLDVSRNGVPTLATLRSLIRSFALMGIGMLMLYTEDTYEIPGEPLFGYFRGRYSQGELREIDRYAALFGIEVIPCIQTLGHLGQILRWPAYAGVRDTGEVLLAEEEATYRLIEKMIQAASAPFRSRRMHIGMDEAHGIGTGSYRLKKGFKAPFEILTAHLQRVAACCERLGIRPMIWSDMYFRLGSQSHGYYDRSLSIPEEAARAIPQSVDLVYWDYYHRDEAFYEEWIRRHRAMGKEPIFAAGVWTWSRFWAALPHSFATAQAGMKAARAAKLGAAFLTLWGDDGMECHILSALPAMQRFADLAHGCDAMEETAIHLRGSSDIDLDAWVQASGLDCVPGLGEPEAISGNPGKWLLWQDPILGFLARQIPAGLPAHYRRLAERLRLAATGSGPARALEFPALLAEVLSCKLTVREELERVYRSRDVAGIDHLLSHSLPELTGKVTGLWRKHREVWHELYKPFGWEVIERRYGALLARLESLRLLLARLLAEPSLRIEELEEQPQLIFDSAYVAENCLTYAACSAPSMIF
jgi:hypothetical protein